MIKDVGTGFEVDDGYTCQLLALLRHNLDVHQRSSLPHYSDNQNHGGGDLPFHSQ